MTNSGKPPGNDRCCFLNTRLGVARDGRGTTAAQRTGTAAATSPSKGLFAEG